MRRAPLAFLFVVWGQAARGVLRHKGRSSLTTLGIAIAVAAVVWVVALGREGSTRYLELLQGLGDNLVWVEAGSRNKAGVRTGARSVQTLTLDDMEAIRREVPMVKRISPQVDGNARIISARSNWSTRTRGVSPDYLPIKRFDVALGAVFTDDDLVRARNVLLLGQTVREQLFGDEDPVGQVVRVNGMLFTVLGVLAPKGQSATGQDQDDTIMIPYTTAVKKLRAPGVAWVDDIVCSAATAEAVVAAAELIAALMRERHHIGPEQDDDFNIRHPEDVVKAQLEASETLARLLIAVASVSLLVGGIGVMNVMLASVTERTREIGLRMAVGASPRMVTLQFLAEAVLLCVAGGVAGVLVSILGASAIGGSLGWSLSVPPEALGVAIGVSTVVGVVFGYMPARRAARLDPIVALHEE